MYEQKSLLNKIFILVITLIFIGAAIAPCVSVVSKEIETQETIDNQDEKVVTCYVFDKKGKSESEVVLSYDDFEKFYSMFEELNHQVTYFPFSSETEVLKEDFIDLIENMGMIPKGSSKDDVLSFMNPSIGKRRALFSLLPNPISNGRGSALFCNFATMGEGSQFPVIILPRIIPILLIPIPRVIMHWDASYGVTSCGGLLSGKGFIAEGAQQGTALGFWGIGFSVFLPPVMGFGFIGYALFATATAENIIPWPPNRPPGVSGETPADGSINVPVDLSELSFRISDLDGDRMNYTVTTSPNIGSDSGNNVADGTYTIPVSGLNSNTEYSWHIVVSDGEDTTEEMFSFHTAIEAPFVSNPLPFDGNSWVSVDLTQLSFKLEDLQGDLMDYTVETAPDIGSGSGNGVVDGTYIVDVGGLEYSTDYTWFVNVTDGKYWTRRIFVFKTQPVMVFDPFDEGWFYRKKITINHSMVTGDLEDFPVLVSVVDSDLAVKAQVDGDDILFMDGSGVANRLFHEIEYFDGSGELIAWVNIPSLKSANDTVLYIYYGNAICSSQQYAERTWDSDFLTILHMNVPSGNPYDSTRNHETWQVKNGGTLTYYATGQVGYAIKGKYAENDGNRFDNFGMDWKGLTAVTIEWWFAFDDITQPSLRFGADGINTEDIRNTFSYNSETQKSGWVETWDDGTVRTLDGRLYNWNNGEFHYGASIMDNTGSNYQGLYTDGALTINANPSDFNFANLNNQYYIGSRAPERGKDRNFDGWLDEFRISKIRRSDAWISTSYNTMNDPSNFFSVSPEESVP